MSKVVSSHFLLFAESHNGVLNVLPNSLENQKIEDACVNGEPLATDQFCPFLTSPFLANSNSPFRQRIKVQSHSLYFKIKFEALVNQTDPFEPEPRPFSDALTLSPNHLFSSF